VTEGVTKVRLKSASAKRLKALGGDSGTVTKLHLGTDFITVAFPSKAAILKRTEVEIIEDDK
jgi:hypothetical protein